MSFFDLSQIIEKMMASRENITGLKFSLGKPPLVEVNKTLFPAEIKGLRCLSHYQMEIISRSLISRNSLIAEELVKKGTVFGYFNTTNYRTQFRIKLLKRDSCSVAMRVLQSLNLSQQYNSPEVAENFPQTDFDWTNRHMLLCVSEPSLAHTVEKICEPSKVKMTLAHNASQAIGNLQPDLEKEIVLLDPKFDSVNTGAVAVMRHIDSLSTNLRRNVYAVLMAPMVKTQDTYMAFLNCVNLTFNPEDIESLPLILQNSINDYNQLY